MRRRSRGGPGARGEGAAPGAGPSRLCVLEPAGVQPCPTFQPGVLPRSVRAPPRPPFPAGFPLGLPGALRQLRLTEPREVASPPKSWGSPCGFVTSPPLSAALCRSQEASEAAGERAGPEAGLLQQTLHQLQRRPRRKARQV